MYVCKKGGSPKMSAPHLIHDLLFLPISTIVSTCRVS